MQVFASTVIGILSAAWFAGAMVPDSPVLASARKQDFTVGDPVTAIAAITVTDAPLTPLIKQGLDIRIRIPAGLNMVWDSSDTTANIVGTGADRVSKTVSYEAAGKILKITVNQNFLAGESITVDQLSFKTFSAASVSLRLELEIDLDLAADAQDLQTKAIGAPTVSSPADQVFEIGDSATAMAVATVTDGTTAARITTDGDIRIRIPAGVPMIWDSTDTAALIEGGVPGKVSATVSYEDADKTLRIDVTTNFAAGESINVSGLSFRSFGPGTGSGRLELETNNLNTVADLDSAQVFVDTAVAAASTEDQAFTAGDPVTAAAEFTVHERTLVPRIKAATDLRIRIPAGLSFDWDVSDPAATLSGSASGKVSPTVSYDGSGDVLVLTVTEDFAAGDDLTVSALGFANFGTLSMPLPLDIDVDNDGVADAVDGSTKAVGTPTLLSGGDQVFQVDDAPTAMLPAVISDSAVARITADGDIRIRIPSGFPMAWDETDTIADITGSAMLKVSTTVGYEDGGTTLVLQVDQDFAAGESITVSGLSFADFAAVAAAGHLELETNNLGTVAALDATELSILAGPPPPPAGSEGSTGKNCGLLGIEVLAVLGLLRLRRASR